MKTQRHSPDPKASKGKFSRVGAGLKKHFVSKVHYARFKFKGKRVMRALGTGQYPRTTLPEAKRLLRVPQNEKERTDDINIQPLGRIDLR